MDKTMTLPPSDTPLLQEYERLRQRCVQYANFHPDSKEVCHQLLASPVFRHIPLHGLTVDLALFADNAAIALRELQSLRAGVVEECAKVCDDREYSAYPDAREQAAWKRAAKAIRALKQPLPEAGGKGK